MKIKKLRNNMVMVSPFEETKVGSIYIPDSGKDKPSQGIIVAICDNPPEELKIGAKVLFGKYAGLDMELDNKKVILLHERDIIAVYE